MQVLISHQACENRFLFDWWGSSKQQWRPWRCVYHNPSIRVLVYFDLQNLVDLSASRIKVGKRKRTSLIREYSKYLERMLIGFYSQTSFTGLVERGWPYIVSCSVWKICYYGILPSRLPLPQESFVAVWCDTVVNNHHVFSLNLWYVETRTVVNQWDGRGGAVDTATNSLRWMYVFPWSNLEKHLNICLWRRLFVFVGGHLELTRASGLGETVVIYQSDLSGGDKAASPEI